MASCIEKDVDTNELWHPPTEAEMKVIEAKRERSDRISKIMATYLLKGYKMLDSVCSKCGTIELQDKQASIYCVACEEVDPDIQKDNPALSEEAASSIRAELQFSTERSKKSEIRDTTHDKAISSSAANQPSFETSSSKIDNIVVTNPPNVIDHFWKLNLCKPDPSSATDEYKKTLITIQKKMNWAQHSLDATADPELVSAYLKVVTNCAEAIFALRRII